MGFIYLAIKIPQIITTTIFSTITSHIISFILSTLAHLGLFKSPPDPDDNTSGAGAGSNYILILDGSSPSLFPVPIHVVTAAIKDKVPIISYKDFVGCHGGVAHTTMCSVCLEFVEDDDLIRELMNCKHVFHQKCLDRWVDEEQVNCPLCRSILLPPKKLLSGVRKKSSDTGLSNPGGANNEIDPAM